MFIEEDLSEIHLRSDWYFAFLLREEVNSTFAQLRLDTEQIKAEEKEEERVITFTQRKTSP